MGFRYRKSIKLPGGFRVNLSKSGVGYSWGTKGYRVTQTAKGTTRTTMSIPGTGLSYVEETKNPNGANSGRAPRRLGCLIYVVGVPVIILLVFFTWFLVFREAEEQVQPPPPIPIQSSIQVMAESEAMQAAKDYLTDLGYEITETTESKNMIEISLTVPGGVSGQDENWEEIRSSLLSAAPEVKEAASGAHVVLYLQDNAGNNCLTIASGKETYNAFEDKEENPAANGAIVWITDSGGAATTVRRTVAE